MPIYTLNFHKYIVKNYTTLFFMISGFSATNKMPYLKNKLPLFLLDFFGLAGFFFFFLREERKGCFSRHLSQFVALPPYLNSNFVKLILVILFHKNAENKWFNIWCNKGMPSKPDQWRKKEGWLRNSGKPPTLVNDPWLFVYFKRLATNVIIYFGKVCATHQNLWCK